MSIEKAVSKIIPPQDYKHRNGFNNIPLIEELTENEKKELEIALIKRLPSESGENIDTLIIETLAYLGSKKSVPTLKDLLKKVMMKRLN